jgi:hypothetical protein
VAKTTRTVLMQLGCEPKAQTARSGFCGVEKDDIPIVSRQVYEREARRHSQSRNGHAPIRYEPGQFSGFRASAVDSSSKELC